MNREDRELLKKWEDYDQTYTDPLDDTEILDFNEVEGKLLPFGSDLPQGMWRVGQGQQTNNLCGKFSGWKGCLNVDLHDIITLDGVNYHGKVFAKKKFYSCDRPDCPVCFARGWAVREAEAIAARLEVCAKKFGKPEHIIISVPKCDYHLSYKALKAKAIRLLKKRGVHGGAMIFHAQRYNNFEEARLKNQPAGWYFSLHFHVIGFVGSVEMPYERCRRCKNVWLDFKGNVHVISTEKCLGCKGFEGLTRRCYNQESKGVKGAGWICKVKAKRKTVKGTCWYQLSHATMVQTGKSSRAAAVTWFGSCSYRKIESIEVKREPELCPICHHELEDLEYVGNDDVRLAWVGRKGIVDDFMDEGKYVRWILKPKPPKHNKWFFNSQ